MGARYSLALIQQEISNKLSDSEVKNYSQIISSKICNKAELKNEVLLYETESFLFQVKSNLDILIQLLKYVPNYSYLDTSGDKEREDFSIKETPKIMRKNGDADLAKFFEQECAEWIEELSSLRNEITHRSGLTGFTSFIFDSGTELVTDPRMPNGRLVEEYCSEIYERLLVMYEKIFKEFILPKLQNK